MKLAGKRDGWLVGRYVVYGEIASGGMATVHLGRLAGPSGFARTVAIKRLHPQFAREPDFVTMFLDEARLAARVHHPNVVPTLDAIKADDELLIVMEYVQGETLSRLLGSMRERGEAMPPRIAASILAGVLHGLHAAHEAKDEQGVALNLVHRDVSPQNVIVGVDGVARVLDFGVAKAATRLQTTRDGRLKGKLAYMAPEQLSGGVVNRLTDVYAAGVLLWESLTAKRMIEADTEGEIVAKVLVGDLQAPSTIVSDVPASLDEITMRALAQEPSKRFANAREMGIALEGAGAIAMHSEVGEWVARVAHDLLAMRAQRVADIESAIKVRTPPPPSGGPPSSPGRKHTWTSEAPTLVGPNAPEPREVTRRSALPPTRMSLPPSSSVVPSRARRNILVIDDSEVVLTRIRSALEAEGYEVTTTTQAIGTARHIPTCDMAIIDYHMPGIDGGVVLKSLRAAAAASKAVRKDAQPCLFYMYTGDMKVEKKHEELGFDGYLVAKGDEEALVRQIRSIFRTIPSKNR